MENGKPYFESMEGKIVPLNTFMEHKAAVETVEVYTVPVPAKKANAIVNALREVLPPLNKSGLDLQHLRRLVREEFLSKQVLARMKATAAENALAVKLDIDCAIVDADVDSQQDGCIISGPKSRTSSTASTNSSNSNNSTVNQRTTLVLGVRKPSDANIPSPVPTSGEEQKEPASRKKPRRRSSAEKRAAKREREKAALKKLQALEAHLDVSEHAISSVSSSPSNSPPASPTETTTPVDAFKSPSKPRNGTTSYSAHSSSTVGTSQDGNLPTDGGSVSLARSSTNANPPPIANSQPQENSPHETNPATDTTSITDTLGENTPPTAGARGGRRRRRRSSANKRRARSGSSGSGSTEATNSTGAPSTLPGSTSPKGAAIKKPIKQNILYLLIAPTSVIGLPTIYNVLRPLLFPIYPEVSTIEVPLHASISQEQADEWSALYWPAIYKRGNPFGPHPPYVEQTINKTLPKVPVYMSLVREAAKQALLSGNGLEVGALVVDPSNEEVVAIAGDGRNMAFGGNEKAENCTWGNPLEHAVMRVVGMVAAKRKLREELEIGTKVDFDEGVSLMKDRENTLRHIPSTDIEKKYFYSINKKYLPATAIFTTDNAVTAPNTGEDPTSLVDTEKKGRETGEYLCHNHIVYLTHEPCVMCSMALIHSRIGMVVIDARKKASRPGWGGLYVGGSPFHRPAEEQMRQLRRKQKKESGSSGSEAEKSCDSGMGAGYGLFWRKELNWKFLAFEWIDNGHNLEEEVDGHDYYP